MVVLRGGPTLPILQRWQQAREQGGMIRAMDDNMYEPVSQCQAPNPDSLLLWGQSPALERPQESGRSCSGCLAVSWGIFRRTRGSGLPPERLTLPPRSCLSASETWSKPQGGDGARHSPWVSADPRVPLMPFLCPAAFCQSQECRCGSLPQERWPGLRSLTATRSHQQVWAALGPGAPWSCCSLWPGVHVSCGKATQAHRLQG